VTQELSREQIMFHLNRGVAWTEAALEHKGMPPQPVWIPEGPTDIRAVATEDRLLEDYKAEVEREKAIKAVASGWITKALGGTVGGSGLLAMVLSFLKNRKKDKTLAEYNAAIESLPKSKRIELGKDKPAMTEHHKKVKST